MDGRQRVAVRRVGAAFPGDNSPAIVYHLGDHIGSSHVVIDSAGAWTNREEYTPYGETSFGGFARKRYRFTGKERDEESGLYYHGARYYAPWLARWTSCDPVGAVNGPNLYLYVSDNPLVLVDPTGKGDTPPESTSPPVEETAQVQENRRVGKAREYIWEKVLNAHPEAEKVVSQTRWKDAQTCKSVKLNGKYRLPDFGVQWREGEGASVEVTSWRNLNSQGKVDQLARDGLATSQGRLLGSEGKGYVTNVTENVKVGGLPSLGMDGQGGNVPTSPVRVQNKAPVTPEVATDVVPEVSRGGGGSKGNAGFIDVGLGLGLVSAGLLAWALYGTYVAMNAATERAVDEDSATPIVVEGARQTAIWTSAWAGGKAGFALGFALGIETGPGAFPFGLAGSIIGATLGAETMDALIEGIHGAPQALGPLVKEHTLFPRPNISPF